MCFRTLFFSSFFVLSLSLSLFFDKDILLERQQHHGVALCRLTHRDLCFDKESSKTNTTEKRAMEKTSLALRLASFASFGRRVCPQQKASENRRGFLVVLCAKKNGKKKKKKTNDGEQQQQQQQQREDVVQPKPRRITGKKNGVSVNAQIRLVDRWKKKAAASTNEMTSLTGPQRGG